MRLFTKLKLFAATTVLSFSILTQELQAQTRAFATGRLSFFSVSWRASDLNQKDAVLFQLRNGDFYLGHYDYASNQFVGDMIREIKTICDDQVIASGSIDLTQPGVSFVKLVRSTYNPQVFLGQTVDNTGGESKYSLVPFYKSEKGDLVSPNPPGCFVPDTTINTGIMPGGDITPSGIDHPVTAIGVGGRSGFVVLPKPGFTDPPTVRTFYINRKDGLRHVYGEAIQLDTNHIAQFGPVTLTECDTGLPDVVSVDANFAYARNRVFWIPSGAGADPGRLYIGDRYCTPPTGYYEFAAKPGANFVAGSVHLSPTSFDGILTRATLLDFEKYGDCSEFTRMYSDSRGDILVAAVSIKTAVNPVHPDGPPNILFGGGFANGDSLVIINPDNRVVVLEENPERDPGTNKLIPYIAPGCEATGATEPGTSRPHLKVMPNPANDVVRITVPDGARLVTIFDIAGRAVGKILPDLNGDFTATVDVSEYGNGLYIAVLQAANGATATGRFVVQHHEF